jgi:hypothetical protein
MACNGGERDGGVAAKALRRREARGLAESMHKREEAGARLGAEDEKASSGGSSGTGRASERGWLRRNRRCSRREGERAAKEEAYE